MSRSRHYCQVPSCHNVKEKCPTKSFFKYPVDPARKLLWCQALELGMEQVAYRALVCSDHFDERQFSNTNGRSRLVNGAIPNTVSRPNEPQPDNFVPQPDKSVPQPLPLGARNGRSGRAQQLNRRLVMTEDEAIAPTFLNISSNESSENRTPSTSSSAFSSSVNSSELLTSTPLRDVSKLDHNSSSPGRSRSANAPELTPKTRKIKQLERRMKTLKQKHTRLKNRISRNAVRIEDLEDLLQKTFGTPSCAYLIKEQWARFTTRVAKHYNEEEKISALTLMYTFRPNEYRKLKTALGLTLPSITSIRRWLSRLTLTPGINTHLFECIKDRVRTMNTYERDCVLVWDEMSIKSLLFDKNLDQFEGIVNHGGNRRSLDIASEVLVVLLRGMNTNWIFPLSYYFSKGPTTTQDLDILLSEVLQNLQRTGLNVRVGVCDQGFTNRGSEVRGPSLSSSRGRMFRSRFRNFALSSLDPAASMFNVSCRIHMRQYKSRRMCLILMCLAFTSTTSIFAV